jgi:hypothetical protein
MDDGIAMRPSSLIRRLRELRVDQSGFAVPTALMALVASFGLASVAVISSVDVQQGTNRDHASKEAIAAADAGASVAMLRLNRFVSRLTPTTPCVGASGESQTPTSGWCPYSPTETTGGATYRYAVSAYTEAAGIQVVSTGTAGRVTRRVAVSMTPEVGKNVFEGEHLIGELSIENKGNVEIHTNVGSNGNVFKAGGSGSLCGNERVGVGKKSGSTWIPQCEGAVTEGNKTLPPVVPPANIATVNSNCRLTGTCGADTASKNVSFNASKRELSLQGNATLTMGGENYWLCKLDVQSGTIYMPVGAHVRIFIDTPEHCGLPSGATQVEFKGSSGIQSTGYNPSQGFYEVPGIYLVGNGAVNLGGNSSTDELMLYAPLSKVEIFGTANWVGMIAGREIVLSGTPNISSSEKIKPPPISYPPTLLRTRYVECVGTATTPSAGC